MAEAIVRLRARYSAAVRIMRPNRESPIWSPDKVRVGILDLEVIDPLDLPGNDYFTSSNMNQIGVRPSLSIGKIASNAGTCRSGCACFFPVNSRRQRGNPPH